MIQSLRLKNFRRYRDETFSFEQGTNFIEGENNAGKTTLFYAVEYALFGQVANLRSPASLMHPGQRGMGVEVVFVARDGHTYRLQRVHQRPPRSKTKVEGHFTLKQKPEGEENERYLLSSDFQDHEEALALKLQDLLGLSKRGFELAVHIRQGEISSILQGDPKLDIVLGVTAAVVAAEELRGMALENEKEATSLPVLEASLERVEQERARRDEELGAARTQLGALEEQVGNLASMETQVAEIAATYRPVGTALSVLEGAREKCSDGARKRDELRTRLSERAAKDGSSDAVKARQTELAQALGAHDKKAEELEARLRSEREQRRTLERQRGDLSGRIERREKLPTGEGARCETCGQLIDLDKSAAELASWRNDLADLDRAISERAQAVEAAESDLRSVERERADLAAERGMLERAASEMEELEQATQAAENQAEQAEGALHSSAREALEAASAAVQSSRALVEKDETLQDLAPRFGELGNVESAEAIEELYGTLREELIRLRDAKKERAIRLELELREKRERQEQLRAELTEREEQAADVDRELARLTTEITSLRKKRDQAEKLRVLQQAFKELQLELREKASAALARDTLAIHHQLSSDDKEFTGLTIDPARYSVNVTPADVGQEVPAFSYQGGGHKLLLGLAFKLAVARMVGPTPFVLLDEPTYGLDVTRRRALLNRVEDLELSRQMLLITHQRIGDVRGRHIEVMRKGKTSVHQIVDAADSTAESGAQAEETPA